MFNTIFMTCISWKSRDGYKNRIVRPNIINAAWERASGSFWSKYLLHKKRVHKKRVRLVLPEKCWELLNAVCEVPYMVIIYKNITDTRISSLHFLKSAGYTLIIFIISVWTVKYMPLHFWVLCGICSLRRL